jgi:hypothetical protein
VSYESREAFFFVLSNITVGTIKGYHVKTSLPNMAKELCFLNFMKDQPKELAKESSDAWLFGICQAIMTKNSKVICQAPQDAIDDLQLVGWGDIEEGKSDVHINLLTMLIVASFASVLERRIFHLKSFTLGGVKYQSKGDHAVVIIKFDVKKFIENARFSITFVHPRVVLLLMYYKFILGRFVRIDWIDVYKGCCAKWPVTFC